MTFRPVSVSETNLQDDNSKSEEQAEASYVSVCDSPRKHGKRKEKVHASCVSVDGRLSIHGKGKEKGQKINAQACGQE